MKEKNGKSQGTINPTSKKYLIPQRLDLHHVELVEVSKDTYDETQRWINRERKKAQRRGECSCPKEMLWKCDGCCIDCLFRRNPNRSLDEVVYQNQEDGSEITLGETIADPTSGDMEERTALQILFNELCAYLDEVDPKARAIFDAVKKSVDNNENKALRSISEELGMPWSTFKDKLNKIREFLKK